MAGGRLPAIRSLVTRALAIGLTVAAATAIAALLSGSFDETEARIIGTSLGFSIFSATAAAGEAARTGRAAERAVGLAATLLSAAAFLALLYAIWALPDDEGPWEVWGVLAVAALVTSHGSL